jgi:hypothetical protein
MAGAEGWQAGTARFRGESRGGPLMYRAVVGSGAVLAAALFAAAPAAALIVGGGGSKGKDCLVVFDAAANFPVGKEKQVRCVDGDPACDTDGVVNASCSVAVRVCVNSTSSSECTLSGVSEINVDHSFDNGADPKFDPDFLAMRLRIDQDFIFPVTTADTCTGSVTFTVPIKGPLGNNHCSRKKKKLKLRSQSTPSAGLAKDTDTLKLICEPATVDGCDPQALFTGTFDRIQRQIFNHSCAVASCHDSESQSGGLLLETGASYGNLVNQTPTNASANADGWRRVTVFVHDVIGEPDISFMFRKIEGDLPDATYGEQMPRGKPKLNGSLREIIRLWIEAGAPQTGWVPDTF